MKRPTTQDCLHLYILMMFGVELPRKAFTPGHSTPFRFVSDAFFNPHKDAPVKIRLTCNRTGRAIMTILAITRTQA